MQVAQSVISALRQLREDYHKFKACLGHRVIQVFLLKKKSQGDGDGLELQLSGGAPSWHAQGPEFNWKGGKKVHMNTQVRKRLNKFDSFIYNLDE